jgi:hypothetical protein
MSRHFIWMVPLSDLILFSMMGLVLALVAKVLHRRQGSRQDDGDPQPRLPVPKSLIISGPVHAAQIVSGLATSRLSPSASAPGDVYSPRSSSPAYGS